MNLINIIGTIFDNSIDHIAAFANLIKDLRLNRNQLDINEDLLDRISRVDAKKEKSKGFFPSLASLQNTIPEPLEGDWAVVSGNSKLVICRCETEGIWTLTQLEFNIDIPLNGYVKTEDLKTINEESILIDPLNPYKTNIEVAQQGGGPGDGYHHIVLTLAEYDALNNYDNRTIYLIISSRDNWGLGDPLPIILASENPGQENPEPEDTTWKFGQLFPIKFEDTTWKFGQLFPIKLK